MKPYFPTLACCVGLLAIATAAQSASVFDRGATWRWRPGTNEASAPVTAWRLNGFNDAQFVTAPSPFWFDTTGDSSTLVGGTQISGMQNIYNSIFLRKTFVVSNASEVATLKLGTLVDDGFVAWINGTEVLRVNMADPAGTAVTISTPGQNATEPVPFVITNLPASSGYLVNGTNVIAVQVFQSAIGSSDLDFDASLDAVLVETNPPTIVNFSPVPGTVTNLTQITVTFSEPVAGVVAAHLLVAGIGAMSVTPGNSSTYTFTFLQPLYGAVPITWSLSQNITDLALPPNPFDATGPGATWSYTLEDNTPPGVASLTPASGATVRSLTNIIVLFSEAVSGVDASDLLINDVPASGVIPAAASQYTFTFPPPATGTVQVAWADGHGITDQASSPNAFAGGAWTYRLDPNAGDALPYISEFMASNTRTLADETGLYPDWIEIYNPSALTVNLDGWSLTDNDNNLTKWRFPATNLAGGRFLVVFASGNDRRIPGARLHTSFQLSSGGEYLALIKPDGSSIVSEFRPVFPQQVPDVSYGSAQFANGNSLVAGTNGVYFTTPTPGAANVGGATSPGPVIEAVQHTPNVPLDNEGLLVTARVSPSFSPVASVTMRYRIMFDTEVTVPMFDDGAHGDGAMGDGTYGATIPANLSTNGQMIRYLIAATDVNSKPSRWPLFTNPTNTAEYLGTIVNPTNLTSKLPIFHLFAPPTVLQPGPTTSQIGADSENGGRVAIYYDGEFYDNIYMELRGNTSAGLNKKAHRLEFNREHEFRHAGPGGRTRKSSLLAEFLDPAYLRQHLCFWFLNQIGVPAPFDYPVRLQLNGQFYQLAFHNDVIGQEQVERLGYDPAGALYKAVGVFKPDFFSTGVFQKLEPDNDTSRTDYLALANGINEASTLTVRRNTVFDMLDVAEVINHLAGTRWCAENDDVWANMSMYRDTFGDQLWRNIPFDMNASWGQRYGGSNPLDTTNDSCKSHPLYGGSATPACDAPGPPNNFNRMYDVIIALPETRQMLLRRMRTIMDQWIQPPGTPAASLILENYIKQMTNVISVEANLDRAKWGFSPWAAGKTFNDGVGDLLNQFVGPRRQHFYVTHCITNTSRPIGITPTSTAGIPLTQRPDAVVLISGIEFNPASGNQDQEYICLTNPSPSAVDLSGWNLSGGVQFAFHPGTVMPSNSVMYLSPNTPAFRARDISPRGGQGLFVQGSYKGHLSAWGETLTLADDTGRVVTTNGYVPAPTLAQRFLRITEIMYNPSPLAGNTNEAQQFEFIELKNIGLAALDLRGVRFTNGIEFAFSGSAVTNLAPGARVIVVRNQTAFIARHGGGLSIAGQFAGALDSNGETLRLEDAVGEKILEFSYNNSWHPITDGYGFSLVIVNENAYWDTWGDKASWRPSGLINGSPGLDDPAPPTLAGILINELLSHSVPPALDVIELYNPTAGDVNIGGWFITDDATNPFKFRIPDDTMIFAGSHKTFSEADFNPTPGTPPSFAFGSRGDEAYLFSGDANTNLTGYIYGFSFDAGETNVTFGRHISSDGKVHFVAQSVNTLGTNNAAPKVGPIVFSEIMYHPTDLPGGADNSDDEFIELHNITGADVSLFDPGAPTNTWRLRGGVDFDFPANTNLAASGDLLLVNFNPTNAVQLAAFRAKFSISASVPIFGPYSGKLNNSSDTVKLFKPDAPVGGQAPYILVEAVDYKDSSPWTPAADGTGASLHRVNLSTFGDDATNWIAATATPGSAPGAGTAPSITTQPVSLNGAIAFSASFSVTATGSEPLNYQWRFGGSVIGGATNSTLSLSNIKFDQGGDYSVVVFNAAGSTISSNATLNVLFPPGFYSQPASLGVHPGTNVTFFAGGSGTLPLIYRWQFNDMDIPGATNASYSIANVQPVNSGNYTVVLSNPAGSLTSSNATLIVHANPFITLNLLTNISARVGTNVTFTVAATTSTPITYEWFRNGTNIPGAVGSSYALTNVQLTNEGVYTVRLSNAYGSIVSAAAALSILISPVIIQQHTGFTATQGPTTNLVVLQGETVSFTISANANPLPISYRWRRINGGLTITNIMVSATNATLVLTNVQTSVNSYNVAITNVAGASSPQLSTAVHLTVLADNDRDGIADDWERQFGFNTNNLADASADPDNDGMNNRQEYLAGTNPTNGLSYLKIDAIGFDGAGTNTLLTLSAVSNRAYSILYRDLVHTGTWVRLADVDARPTNRVVTLTNQLPVGVTNRFYRLQTPKL